MGNAYTTTTDSAGTINEKSIYFERERCQKCNRNACFARVVEAQIAARRKSYGNFAIPGSIYFRPNIGSILTKSSPALNDDAPCNEKNHEPNYPFHHLGPTPVPPETNEVGIKSPDPSKPAPFDSNANNDPPRGNNENTHNPRSSNSNRDNVNEIPVPDQRRAGTSTPVQRANNKERQTPRDTILQGQPYVNSGVGDETTFQGQIFGQGGGYENREGQRNPSNPSTNDHVRAPDTSFELDYVPVDELANAGTSPSISRTNSNPSIPIVSPLNVPIIGNNPRPSSERKLQDNGQQQNASNVSGTDPRVNQKGLLEPKNGNRASETKSEGEGTPQTLSYPQQPESSDGPSERPHNDGSRKSSYAKDPDLRNRRLKQIQNRGLSFEDDDGPSLPPASGAQDNLAPDRPPLVSTEPQTSNQPADKNASGNGASRRTSSEHWPNVNKDVAPDSPDLVPTEHERTGQPGGEQAFVTGSNLRQNSDGSRGLINNSPLRTSPSVIVGAPDGAVFASTGPNKFGQPGAEHTIANSSPLRRNSNSPRGPQNDLTADEPTSIKDLAPDGSHLLSDGANQPAQPTGELTTGSESPVRLNFEDPSGSLTSTPVSGPTFNKGVTRARVNLPSNELNASGQPAHEQIIRTVNPLRETSNNLSGSVHNVPAYGPASVKGNADPRDYTRKSSYPISLNPENDPGLQPVGTREEKNLNQRPSNGSEDPSSYNTGGESSTSALTPKGIKKEIEPEKRSYFDTVSQRLPHSERPNSIRGDGGFMVTPRESNGGDVYPQQNSSPIAPRLTSSGLIPANPAELLPKSSAYPDERHTASPSSSTRTSGPSYSTRVTDSGNSPASSVDASIYPIYDPENKPRSHPGNTYDSRQPKASFKKDSTVSSDSPQTGVTGARPHEGENVDQAVQDEGRLVDSIGSEPDGQRYSPRKLGQSDSNKPSVHPSGEAVSSPPYAVVPTMRLKDSLVGPATDSLLGSGPQEPLNQRDEDRPTAPTQRSSDSKSPTSRSLGSADEDDGIAASLPAKDVDGGQHRPLDIRQPTEISGPVSPGGQEPARNPESGTPNDQNLVKTNGGEILISMPEDGIHVAPSPDSANRFEQPSDRRNLITKGGESSVLGYPDSTLGRTIPSDKPTVGQPDAEPGIGVKLVQPTKPNDSSITKEQSTPKASEFQTGKGLSHDPPRALDDLPGKGRTVSSATPESLNPLDNSSPQSGPKRPSARNDQNDSEHPLGPQSDKIFDKEKERDAAQSAVGTGITFASEVPDKMPESSKPGSTVHSNASNAARPSPPGTSYSPVDQTSEFPYESAIGPGLVFKHSSLTTGIVTNVTETEEIMTGPPSLPGARSRVPEGEGQKVIGRTPEEPERSPPDGIAKIPPERPLTSEDKTSERPYIRARPNTQPKLKASGPSVTTLDRKKNKLQRPSDKLFRLNHPDNAGCLIKVDNMIAYNKCTKKPIKKDLKMTDFIRVVDSGRGKCLRPQSMRSIESDAELMTCHPRKKREQSCAPWSTAFTIIYPSSSAHCPPGTIRRKDGFFAVPKKGAQRKGKWYQQEDESKRRQCSLSKEYKSLVGKCSNSRRAIEQTNVQKSCPNGEVHGNVRSTKKQGNVELSNVKRPQTCKPTVLEYEKLPSGLQDSFKNLKNELDQYARVCHQVNENLNDKNHTPRLCATEQASWSPIKLTPRKRKHYECNLIRNPPFKHYESNLIRNPPFKHDECNLIRNPPLICPDPNPCCLESYCPCNPCRPQECCYNNVQCIPCVPMAYNVCSAEQIQVNDAAASQLSMTKEDDKIDALVQETLSNAEIGLTRALGSRTSLTHATISDGATDLSEWMNRLRARLATGMNMPLEIKRSRCSSDDDLTDSALQNTDKEKTGKPSRNENNPVTPEELKENLQNVLQGIDHALQSPNMSARSSMLNVASLLDATAASPENDTSLQIAGFESDESNPMSDESSNASMVPSDCVTPVPRTIGSSNNCRPVRVRFSNPIVQDYWTPDSNNDEILVAEVDSNDNYRFLDDGNELLGQEYHNEAVMENV